MELDGIVIQTVQSYHSKNRNLSLYVFDALLVLILSVWFAWVPLWIYTRGPVPVTEEDSM